MRIGIDGIDHINVYSKGKTELGRKLTNFAYTPFDDFASVEGWWYWYCTGKKYKHLKKLYGFKAKQEGKKYERIWTPTSDILKQVYHRKLECNHKLRDSVINSSLPFTHYYDYSGKVVETEWVWTGELWNIIQDELRERQGMNDKYDVNSTEQRIQQLVSQYKYKKLPKELSEEVRSLYQQTLPSYIQNVLGNDIQLYSNQNTLICNNFERIVVGDYGAFIEFSRDSIVKVNIRCEPGQEYRFRDEKYKQRVKYFWYTTKDTSHCKIYFQQKTVTYADYKPMFFYISPYEVKLGD